MGLQAGLGCVAGGEVRAKVHHLPTEIDSTDNGKGAVLIFAGTPGWPIEDIALGNITMRTADGGTAEEAAAALNERELDVLAGY
ncbi:MAG: hypothetical protein JJU36_12290 [Phycisphaeraceae bacterium]|nr:hypothetical protein [Phycisphaeraceae bacterium]